MNKDGEKFEKWAFSRNEHYLNVSSEIAKVLVEMSKEAFQAGLAAARAEAQVLVEALEHYYPILRQYGCTRNGDHDDSSWCTELCCDYGKLARQALAAYRKEPRP